MSLRGKKLYPFSDECCAAVEAAKDKPETSLEKLIANLHWELHYKLCTLREFAEAMTSAIDNPLGDVLYPLSWGQTVFEHAAQTKVLRWTIDYLSGDGAKSAAAAGMDFEDILDETIASLRSSVMRGAKWPKFSTSPTSNLAIIYENAARAELLEKLKQFRTKIDMAAAKAA